MKISTEELRQALKEVREEELNLLLKICEKDTQAGA
jgi:Ca2+-binding EF-hand superfamily protein